MKTITTTISPATGCSRSWHCRLPEGEPPPPGEAEEAKASVETLLCVSVRLEAGEGPGSVNHEGHTGLGSQALTFDQGKREGDVRFGAQLDATPTPFERIGRRGLLTPQAKASRRLRGTSGLGFVVSQGSGETLFDGIALPSAGRDAARSPRPSDPG